MWTISYKGFYIHGYCHKDEVTAQVESADGLRGAGMGKFKSLHACKCWITRYLNSQE